MASRIVTAVFEPDLVDDALGGAGVVGVEDFHEFGVPSRRVGLGREGKRSKECER